MNNEKWSINVFLNHLEVESLPLPEPCFPWKMKGMTDFPKPGEPYSPEKLSSVIYLKYVRVIVKLDTIQNRKRTLVGPETFRSFLPLPPPCFAINSSSVTAHATRLRNSREATPPLALTRFALPLLSLFFPYTSSSQFHSKKLGPKSTDRWQGRWTRTSWLRAGRDT